MVFLHDPHFQAVDSSGNPLSGAKLYFYQVGTTTAITTYQDAALATPHASPVVADASGRFAPIYLNTSPYKTLLTTSADVTVQTVQNVYGGFDGIVTKGSDIASAATLNLDAATGPNVNVTGTTTTTAITLSEGRIRLVRAAGAWPLTASANLIVNGSASIPYICTAEDELLAEGFAAGVVRIRVISPAGTPNPLPSGHIFGLHISNNVSDATNDIDIAAGTARDGANTANLVLASSLTKRLDATWAVGTGNGGRFDASISDAWWYPYLIRRPDTGVVDVGFSTNISDPTGGANYPADYTQYRRIRSFLRESGAIVPIYTDGDWLYFVSPSIALTSSSLGDSRTPFNVRCPPNMRVAVRVAITKVASATVAIIQSPAETDATPALPGAGIDLYTNGANHYATGDFVRKADASSQLAARAGATTTLIYTGTLGWYDPSGRLA